MKYRSCVDKSSVSHIYSLLILVHSCTYKWPSIPRKIARNVKKKAHYTPNYDQRHFAAAYIAGDV